MYKLVLIGFACIWIYLVYELVTAPEYDENERPIKKKK